MVEALGAGSTIVDLLSEKRWETISVSSVLQKKHKEYGKKHLYDGKEETCWNSDQGMPQHVTVCFADDA